MLFEEFLPSGVFILGLACFFMMVLGLILKKRQIGGSPRVSEKNVLK